MVIHERATYNILIMPKGWQELIDAKFCPVCEKKNSRRYRCCSPDCTTKFWLKAFGSWELRHRCFKRDKFICQMCGANRDVVIAWEKRRNRWLENNPDNNPPALNHWDDLRYVKATNDYQFQEIEFDADHVIPIALGGAQFELDNYQTLCRPCHKKKTAKDMKKIALARKNQTTLEEIE